MLVLTQEQQKAYDRFIQARNRVGIVKTKEGRRAGWVRLADVVCSVEITGMNHPVFEANDLWLEYKEAFAAWLKVEPEFRDKERMRMSRGDYGAQDSWEERQPVVKATTKLFLGRIGNGEE